MIFIWLGAEHGAKQSAEQKLPCSVEGTLSTIHLHQKQMLETRYKQVNKQEIIDFKHIKRTLMNHTTQMTKLMKDT